MFFFFVLPGIKRLLARRRQATPHVGYEYRARAFQIARMKRRLEVTLKD